MEIGDSIRLEKDLTVYVFGVDSLHGTYGTLDNGSLLVFKYRHQHSFVFDAFDSCGLRLDRVAIPKQNLDRLLFEFIDMRKGDLFDGLVEARIRNRQSIKNELDCQM